VSAARPLLHSPAASVDRLLLPSERGRRHFVPSIVRSLQVPAHHGEGAHHEKALGQHGYCACREETACAKLWNVLAPALSSGAHYLRLPYYLPRLMNCLKGTHTCHAYRTHSERLVE
jgi:hypothetical protein